MLQVTQITYNIVSNIVIGNVTFIDPKRKECSLRNVICIQLVLPLYYFSIVFSSFTSFHLILL